MSITDEGQYGDKQIRFLEAVWGEGFFPPAAQPKLISCSKARIAAPHDP